VSAAWYASAQALFALDRPEEARALMDQKLAENPDDWSALMVLAVAAIDTGERNEAQRWMERLAALPSAENSNDWIKLVTAFQAAFGEQFSL